MKIKTVCPMCGDITYIEMDDEEYARYQEWRNGKMLIQEALPNRSHNEREMLKTGICSFCWEEIFGLDDDVAKA